MSNLKPFKKIALIGKPGSQAAQETVDVLCEQIQNLGLAVYLPESDTYDFPTGQANKIPFEQIGQSCDLAIVVGGDGSMLKTARDLIDSRVPML